MRKASLALFLALVMTTSSGCLLYEILGLPFGKKVPFNPKKVMESGTIARNIQFLDVPVPMGFVLRRDQLFSYQCATFRVGHFFYEGAWPYRRTKGFYDNQMRIHGWTRMSEQEGDIMAEQFWAKGSDRCRIIYDNGGDNIILLIDVYPVGSPPKSVEIK